MGVTGLVLGILGAIGAFLPGVVFFAWLLALIGIIVSAIAMKKGQGGIAVAGLVLSIVGFVIALPRLLCAVVCAQAVDSFGRGMGAW